jgi:hypothetical protein
LDPLTILAALAPVGVEAVKAAVSRWLAPDVFKPATIEQYSTMQNLQLQWFKAVTDAGGSGITYQWVEAVKQLMRPTVAAIVILTWANQHGFLWSHAALDTGSVDNFASAIGFYLFGDRTLFYAKKTPLQGNGK